MKNLAHYLSRFLHFVWRHSVGFGSALILLCCWGMLEFSCIPSLEDLWEYLYVFDVRYAALNYLTIGILWALFMILFRRAWLSDLLCSILCGGLAIANYYVISFHGMPLSFLLIKNFTTAMNVISGYQFTIGFHVGTLLIAIIILTVLSLLIRKREAKQPALPLRKILLRDALLVLMSGCILFFGYFGPKPIKPKRTITWLWSEAYSKYGYLACSIETLCQLFDSVTMPEGYSEEKLAEIQIDGAADTPARTPDIFLILNESFYDLRQITDLETDVPYMSTIEGMEDVLMGTAIVPNAGGGTNVSEYELLSSNSSYLMPGVTPFNILELQGANSIVSHLTQLGYSTQACHPARPANYSRVLAYPRLGFQNVYFQDDFTDRTFYGNRPYENDASLYANMLRWYEQSPEDAPRFAYALTFQNHGSWDMNPPEMDTVHCLSGVGDQADLVNEYLSSLALTDTAFKELTEYFAQSDREVIICMMGDHAPSFASSIADPSLSEEEKALNLRKVPLLIWANFDLPETELGTMSMNYVVPTLLELAGTELSPYYRYQLQLKEQVPILSSYGSYYDLEGNLYRYDSDEGSPYAEAVDNYFYLEYNNLQKNRDQSLFQPGA